MTECELLEGKIRSRIRHLEATMFSLRTPIRPWKMRVAPRYLDGGIPRPDGGWETVGPGSTWMPEAEATWFLATAVVPEGWGGGPLMARLRLGGEAQVFVNGQLLQSIHSAHTGRDEVLLADEARPGERYRIAVEATRLWHPLTVRPQHFEVAELAVPQREVEDLVYWLRVALEAARTMAAESTERLRLVRLLDKVMTGVNLQEAGKESYLRSARAAGRRLEEGLEGMSADAGPGSMALIGHAHIDTAWLWPLSETKRKCGRTFSNVLTLMKHYPDFYFSQSQPQLYKFTKECFPEVYEGIKQRIAEGRWEVIGGAWVECDCNVSGGEALIRQLLYGKRFLREEFGQDTDVGWWPDAFGYSWSLPQILAHCGMRYFLTTKIGWNQYNTFPYGMFWWQGIDGTRLLAVQATMNYNGAVTPEELVPLWRGFPERDRVDEYVNSFGYGDGGGGPTARMIEYGRRLSGMVGVPRCRFGKAAEFFKRAEKRGEELPVWNGELYLELHRGCQTSQARTKRGNRKLELLLRDMEVIGAMAGVLDAGGYPRQPLQEMWEKLLCFQFHDVLPGSSVRPVYEEAERDYAEMMGRAEGLRERLLEKVAKKIDTRGKGKAVVVFNTLSWERTEVVEVEANVTGDSFAAIGPSGERQVCQVLARKGREVRLAFRATAVPPFGYALYHIVPAEAPGKAGPAVRASRTTLENDELRLRFDRRGRLMSVFDKRSQREVLAPGAGGNLLQCFDDRPMNFEAWDIDPWFDEQGWEAPAAESVEVVEVGPVRAALRMRRRTDHSTVTQEIRLAAGSRRVDFVTHIDWHERRVLLKCAFPVDVLAPEATFEIQFGAIARPTHNNTTWDRAKFEVPAHRWADLSEAGYGVALLNDCKYGYDVKGNVLRLSLLRSPTDPDPEADQGEHEFTYSLYPHEGRWQEAGVVRQGLELNAPLLAIAAPVRGGVLPAAWSGLRVSRPSVVVEALKEAEEGDDLILRVYEAHGGRGPVELRIGLPVERVAECDGMEEEIAEADWSDGVLRFEVRPWQIRSFRMRVQG